MVTVTVQNIGNRPGSEVIQLYIHDEKSTLQKPHNELKVLRKVRLCPGEEQTVVAERAAALEGIRQAFKETES